MEHCFPRQRFYIFFSYFCLQTSKNYTTVQIANRQYYIGEDQLPQRMDIGRENLIIRLKMRKYVTWKGYPVGRGFSGCCGLVVSYSKAATDTLMR